MITFELLEERMAFLEDLGYDKHFYACFPGRDNAEYELYLQKDKKWVIRQRDSDVPLDKYPGMSRVQVLQNLGCLGINEEEVLQAISHHCLTQVTYADLVVQEATKLFGSQTIESARQAQRDFHKALVETIQKFISPVEALEGEGQTSPKKTGHLSVIK